MQAMILLVFLVWPLLEIGAAIAVAHEIGVLWCILALIAGIPAGTLLMPRRGAGDDPSHP